MAAATVSLAQLQLTCVGAYLPVEVTQLEGSGGANHGQQLMLQLPSGLGRGSVQIEIARGGFISQAAVNSPCLFACFVNICMFVPVFCMAFSAFL